MAVPRKVEIVTRAWVISKRQASLLVIHLAHLEVDVLGLHSFFFFFVRALDFIPNTAETVTGAA